MRQIMIVMNYQADPTRYATMPYRTCGRSGLKLPAVSLGLWHNFGDATPMETQRAMLRTAFDLGITHFDLANNYGPPYGSAETNFGEHLRRDFKPYRDELIISSKAGLSFNDFLIHLTPIVIIVMVVLIVLLPRLFPGAFTVDPERVADVMSLEEKEAIRNPRLLIECCVVLVAVFAAFIAHSALHMEPSIVALLGAGVLVVVSRLEHTEYLSSVEWETLLFFAGLFVMVGALVKTGVMKTLAHLAITATGGNVLVATMVILNASMLISGFVNNVPYAAAMTPIVGDLAPALAGHADPGVLWWSLALGTDFGGNLTAVGASANVIVIGMAARSDNPISFGEFTRKGAVVTAVSVALAAAYLYLRYLMVT